MDEDLDRSIQVDVLASILKAEQKEATRLLELLARMLESALPERTKVKRAGWFMSKERPIAELSIEFDDVGYQIVRSKHGTVSVKQQKIVRGIALKTTDIEMEQCINDLVGELSKLAGNNTAARESLNRFISGI